MSWTRIAFKAPPPNTYVLVKTVSGLVRVAKRVVYKDNSEEYRYSSQHFKNALWWQPLPK